MGESQIPSPDLDARAGCHMHVARTGIATANVLCTLGQWSCCSFHKHFQPPVLYNLVFARLLSPCIRKKLFTEFIARFLQWRGMYMYMDGWMDGWTERSADLDQKSYLQPKEQREDPIIKLVYFADIFVVLVKTDIFC